MRELIFLFFFCPLLLSAGISDLHEYESVSHIDPDKFPKQRYRTFDKDGVIMQDGVYHPLTICFYGILNYDAFTRTDDSTYYHRAVNQYKYFTDAHFIFRDNNQSIGILYYSDAHDLKAPWVSGMTQGAAVSYLLRYYELTRDTHALNLCPAFIRLLLKPEQEGGTLGRTKENLPWIEEYPNSKKHEQVMNGFINGFIGLHEYCEMFPMDWQAIIMRDSCYNSLIASFNFYDTPDWTTYSRGTWDVTNGYMHCQLRELEHLYSLFSDERLRNQMRIWSMFAVGKPDLETLALKKPDYQFAELLHVNPTTDSLIFSDYRRFSTGLVIELPSEVSDKSIHCKFSGDRYYFELKHYSGSRIARQIQITGLHQLDTIEVNITYRKGKVMVQSSDPIDELVFRFPDTRTMKVMRPSLKSYDYKSSDLSLFGICKLSKTEVLTKGREYHFDYAGTNLVNATVFYRYAPSRAELKSKKYNLNQAFRLEDGTFIAPETGTYEFFISYDLMHPKSSLAKLKLVPFQE